MARTARVRQRVRDYLATEGTATTREILDAVNSSLRHGSSTGQLNNLLSGDTAIEKVGPRHKGHTTWRLRDPHQDESD